ncbi:MAG: tryptophan--tRNA ligase, partial [Bacilli bacterium]
MERILTGIQPSGQLTIGNYIGSIQQVVALQDKYESFMFIANLHSITVSQDKKNLVKNTIDLVSLYLACGIDPNKTTIFLQSDVAAHAQLGWILQCHTYMGELNRMTQFKDKTDNLDQVSSGLYTYPALMAADILLYDPAYVPVGEDQRQHLELTKTLATRFNNKYSETFIVPQAKILKDGAKIMSLANPDKKMSKSDSAGTKACIFLLDTPTAIMKKIKSATTDSLGIINYDPIKQPGISNLLVIYASLNALSIEETL